ncbi:MAG: hypothetical protein NWS71_08770, partial [Opitutales bacterium]|nr:hypothetical protein [Opitutales bacterium]
MLRNPRINSILAVFLLFTLSGSAFAKNEPINISGVYPHLTMYNTKAECGTGALVPWAGKLWA